MGAKKVLGAATLWATPVLLGMTGYFLATAAYAAAFWSMVAIVLCMETRVRMGWRQPRPHSFWLHVAAGAALLLALGALALWPMPAWMPFVAAALLLVVALGGGALLWRQVV